MTLGLELIAPDRTVDHTESLSNEQRDVWREVRGMRTLGIFELFENEISANESD